MIKKKLVIFPEIARTYTQTTVIFSELSNDGVNRVFYTSQILKFALNIQPKANAVIILTAY